MLTDLVNSLKVNVPSNILYFVSGCTSFRCNSALYDEITIDVSFCTHRYFFLIFLALLVVHSGRRAMEYTEWEFRKCSPKFATAVTAKVSLNYAGE